MSFLFFSFLSLTDDPPPDGEGFGLVVMTIDFLFKIIEYLFFVLIRLVFFVVVFLIDIFDSLDKKDNC